MKKKLQASQITAAQTILRKRLARFPGQSVQPLLAFTEPLLLSEAGVNRKFLVADIENLGQNSDEPESMRAVIAQYLHTLETIRTVILQAEDSEEEE